MLPSDKKIDYNQLPKGLLFVGRFVILGGFLIILWIGWALEFNDKIIGSIELMSEHPPIELKAKKSSQIHLLVNEDEPITSSTIIAYYENPARLEDILQLRKELEKYFEVNQIPDFWKKEVLSLQLGNLQTPLIDVTSAIANLSNYEATQQLAAKINLLTEEEQLYAQYSKLLKAKLDLVEDDIAITNAQELANESLLQDGGISKLEFERIKQEGILKQQGNIDVKTAISEIEILKKQIQKNIVQLSEERNQNRQVYLQQIQTAYARLKAQLTQWEDEFLIKSSVNGQLILGDINTSSIFLTKDELICTILPQEQSAVRGLIKLSARGVGKIKAGQTVNVYLSNYPSSEFGIVRGKVRAAPLLATDGIYHLKVDFPEGLTSTYQLKIPFQQRMSGKAEIIVSKRTFIDRIRDQIKDFQLNQS